MTPAAPSQVRTRKGGKLALVSVVRLYLRCFASLWLASQAVVIAAAPVALHCGTGGQASAHRADATDEHACCRNLKPGQTCPMHRKTRPPEKAAGTQVHTHDGHAEPSAAAEGDAGTAEEPCVVRSACAPSDAALLALTGTIGLLPSRFAVSILERATLVTTEAPSFLARSNLPDPPPPRS
jgi:hypothetical protein